MDFKSFAQCFYMGRRRTSLCGITSQAGIVHFFLHDICPAVGDIYIDYSDDYYRAVFNGKRMVRDIYWKRIEEALKTEYSTAVYRLSDILDRRHLNETARFLGLSEQYLSSDHRPDTEAFADSIITQLIEIAHGLGEGRNIIEARYYTVILFRQIEEKERDRTRKREVLPWSE